MEALLRAAGLPPDGLADQFPGGYAVAERERTLVGAVGIERYGDDGLLRSAVVAPEWRGPGLGERLVRERLAWAAGRGLGAVYLLTNTAAGYFPRLGFRPVDRASVPAAVRASLQFASVCPATAAVMVLSLRRSEPVSARAASEIESER